MTNEDILKLAQAAGIVVTGDAVWRLCELVAAREREMCARLCEARDQGYFNREDAEALRCAAAIRAIGKKAPTLVEKYYGTK